MLIYKLITTDLYTQLEQQLVRANERIAELEVHSNRRDTITPYMYIALVKYLQWSHFVAGRTADILTPFTLYMAAVAMFEFTNYNNISASPNFIIRPSIYLNLQNGIIFSYIIIICSFHNENFKSLENIAVGVRQ